MTITSIINIIIPYVIKKYFNLNSTNFYIYMKKYNNSILLNETANLLVKDFKNVYFLVSSKQVKIMNLFSTTYSKKHKVKNINIALYCLVHRVGFFFSFSLEGFILFRKILGYIIFFDKKIISYLKNLSFERNVTIFVATYIIVQDYLKTYKQKKYLYYNFNYLKILNYSLKLSLKKLGKNLALKYLEKNFLIESLNKLQIYYFIKTNISKIMFYLVTFLIDINNAKIFLFKQETKELVFNNNF